MRVVDVKVQRDVTEMTRHTAYRTFAPLPWLYVTATVEMDGTMQLGDDVRVDVPRLGEVVMTVVDLADFKGLATLSATVDLPITAQQLTCGKLQTVDNAATLLVTDESCAHAARTRCAFRRSQSNDPGDAANVPGPGQNPGRFRRGSAYPRRPAA